MEYRRSVGVLLLVLLPAASIGTQTYDITTTWNGQPIDHKKPVQLTLSPSSDQQYLEVDIDAPFFNDPPAPPGPAGQPFYGLWNYEVVEAFFLNDDNQYLEVEVCPWGQHIVLLLSAQRVTIRHSLPLEVTTQRNPTTQVWTGKARIPVSYLPPAVTKFNAYGIHGSGDNRVYESLYPAPENASHPDFHALQYFQPINMSQLLPDQQDAPMSQLWTDALDGVFRYHITTTWDSVSLTTTPVEFKLQGFQAGVEMNVTAPFYNDPAPNGTAGEPFYGLWNYEVVEMFFVNDKDEYLEVELGPWGEHLLLFLKGERNAIKDSLPLDYIVSEKIDPVGDQPGVWRGSAMIPPGYFPPNVTRMNAYAIHGVDEAREYQALYPAPHDDPDYPNPDFHKLSLFRPIDFEFQVMNNSEYSDVWKEAIGSGSTSISPEFEAEAEVEAVTLLGPVETTPEPTPTPTIPPQQDEESVDQTAFRQDETVVRRRPQPHRVQSTDFRGQRREEDRVVNQPSRVGSRPVPNPQLVRPRDDQFHRRRLQEPDAQTPDQSLTRQGEQFTSQGHEHVEIPPKFLQGNPQFQDERPVQHPPQGESAFQDQRIRPENSQFQDQRLSQQAPNFQEQRPHEERLQVQNQHFQQQDQRFQDQRFEQQGQRFQQQDQRFQQQNQRFQQQDQRFHQQDQRFQQQDQRFQQDPQVQDQRFQQQDHRVQDQRFQQQDHRVQDQRFQQQDHRVQDQRFQQQDHRVQDQRFQQQDQRVQDQRFQQQDQRVQDQRFQQQEQRVQDQRFQQGQRVQDQRFQQQDQRVQDQRFQDQKFQPHESDNAPSSETSLTTLPELGSETDTTIPDVEAVVDSLAEQTAALPPPHPICFEPGLVADLDRCYVFHECVMEDGIWQMYSWRCRRGHVYDPINVACVRGRCKRRRGR